MEKHKLASIYLTMRDRGILLKFSTHRVSRVYWRLFTKNHFPATFGGHLEFLLKIKSAFISETVWDRESFDLQGVGWVAWKLFAKYRFPATFSFHLEFLCKVQKRVYLGNGARESDFDKILDPQGICRVYWRHFTKIALPPFLAGHLEFLCKMQKRIYLGNEILAEFWQKLKMSFISKTLRDKVISSNVWTLWVLETLDIVPVKKVEFPEFCPPSWILVEIEIVVNLENHKG